MKEIQDSDLVSKSFLSVFFMDINNLKNSLTGYRSIILRLKLKTDKSSEELFKNLDEDMKNAVISWSDDVRHNVERCQIAAKSMEEIIDGFDTKNLNVFYEKIINQFTPDVEDVSKFTFEINRLFVKGTIEKILYKMESFYDQFSK